MSTGMPAVPDSSGDEEPQGTTSDRASRRANTSPDRGEIVRSDEQEQFRLFQEFLRYQGQHGDRARRGRRRGDDSDDDYSIPGGKGVAGTPPEWKGPTSDVAFEDWLIKANLWLTTTKVRPNQRGPLILRALSGSPFESFKHLAKDQHWLSSDTNAEDLLRKMDSPDFYGEDQEEHLLSSLSRITFHIKRNKQESWRDFFARWESAMRRVREHRVELPEVYIGFLLIHGLRLEENDIKAMLNFTRGDIKPKAIKAWLRKNEAKLTVSQLGLDPGAKKSTTAASSTSNVMHTEIAETEENYETQDPEIAEIETFLTEYQATNEEEVPDSLSEGEAVEILSTMLHQKKSSYAQSWKNKKHAELSRGYGKPQGGKGKGPLMRSGRYQVTIAELKQKTRCSKCNKKGHWHRECPEGDQKTINDAHYLEHQLNSENEAFFCGWLETMPSSMSHEMTSEPASSSPAEVQVVVEAQPKLSALRSEQYMSVIDDLFWFENLLCSEVKKSPSSNDFLCATVDTGCQRIAVGSETLRRLAEHLPSELEIFYIPSQHSFRSVHGVSSTRRLAAVPCSLGPKGCYLRPALFEEGFAKEAPFLLSLPFLLSTKAKVCLDIDDGLVLRMKNPKHSVRCHIGPSGALRIPLTEFTPIMLRNLKRTQGQFQMQEFEILDLKHAEANQLKIHRDLVSSSDPSVPGHGGSNQQACSQRAELRGDQSLGADTSKASPPPVLCDAVDREVAQEPGDRDQRGHERAKLGNHFSNEPPRDAIVFEPRTTNGAQERQEERRDRWTTRTTSPDRTQSKVPVQSRDNSLGVLHRAESQQDLLPMPTTSRSSMPILPMGHVSAPGGPDGLEVRHQGGRQSTKQQGDLADDDSGKMRTLDIHQTGEQCLPGPAHLQNLCQDPGAEAETQESRRGESEGQRGLRAVQEIHGLAATGEEQVSQKNLRKIRSGLKQVVEFWRQVQNVFLCKGVEAETTTSKIRQMNRELLSDLIRCPKGSKKTRTVADMMHLTTQELKLVAELYNPGCFREVVEKHNLSPGLAFDLQLGNNLLDPKERERVRQYIRTVRPGLTIISPPCHMYSALQNILNQQRNMNSQLMQQYLMNKRKANTLLDFAIEIAELCIQYKLTFVFEHPWSASSWSRKKVEKLIQKPQVFVSRCDQCMTGLCSRTGQLHRKRTGFASNDRHIAEALEVSCNQEHEHEHVIGGQRSKMTQVYTTELKERIIMAYKKSLDSSSSLRIQSSHGVLERDRQIDAWLLDVQEPLHFEETSQVDYSRNTKDKQINEPSMGTTTLLPHVLPEGELPGKPTLETIPELRHGLPGREPHLHYAVEDLGGEGEEEEQHRLPGQRPVSLMRLIQKAHEGLGHPHQDRFLRILRYSKANEEVMAAARTFKCNACARNAQVKPARRAAPPRDINVNEVVGIDVVWLPMHDGRTRPSLNCIDWATHFQMVIPMPDKKPESLREAYRHWLRFFGAPSTLALDLGREFEGIFAVRAETDGSYIDPSSVESPYQRGITERAGKTFKLMLAKTMETYDCKNEQEWLELVDVVNFQKNRLLMKNGFSPIQRVIGYNPKLPGGLLTGDAANRAFADKTKLGDLGVTRAMEMRKAAAMAFHHTDCSEALRRAIASGPRPFQTFEIGEAVYFWRIGQGATIKPAPEYWHGPARVVMIDEPTTLWLAYQGKLVKASPERVRRAGDEEQLTLTGWIDDLVQTREQFEKAPKRGFLDLSQEPLPPPEEEDDYSPEILEDEPELHRELPEHREPEGDRWQGPLPPVVHRMTGKTRFRDQPYFPSDDGDITGDEKLTSDFDELVDNVNFDEGNLENKRLAPTMPTEDEPVSKKTRIEYLDLMYVKVNNILKARQSKEVKLNELCAKNKESFGKAIKKEVTNNVDIGAYKGLDLETSARIRKTNPEKIMSSRYVLTAKPLEPEDVEPAKDAGLLLEWDSNEPHKAKARHVMKGFSENGAENLNSTTPQVTRDAIMLVAQLIASFRWELGFLDFTQAFHSGDPINRTLYAEQPREGVPGMVPGQLLQLLKCCYGLTDGPYSWFVHIRRFIVEELGYEQSRADPCVFYLFSGDGQQRRLRGIIGLATDDMMHGGDQYHQAKMKQIQGRYKLGKFQFGQGRFCGKEFQKEADGSIFIHQQPFTKEKLMEMNIAKERKKQRYSFCTEEEISQLRTQLGSLAWLTKETRPDLAGRIALLQQTMPHPRVRDLIEGNAIVAEAKKFQDSGIRVMPIAPENLRVGIITDASWGNAKGQKNLEENSKDTWKETEKHWIRIHNSARKTLFHPAGVPDGPDLHDILPTRKTVTQFGEKIDDWTKPPEGTHQGELWTGQTIFEKQPANQKLPHENINETFLQLLNTSSQGGMITIYYDKNLEVENTPQMMTVASWKSTRLKRKTVNTLSAECQSMILGVGNVHWHRFLLLEALGHSLTGAEWEQQLAAIPYVAMTDSRSLYDCLHKLICTYTQTDDKRTAIDIAILKDDLVHSGGHARWIEGGSMIADPLTKKMKGDFLRAICNHGKWSLTHAGNTELRKQFEILLTLI